MHLAFIFLSVSAISALVLGDYRDAGLSAFAALVVMEIGMEFHDIRRRLPPRE
jgi:hypothetical protein